MNRIFQCILIITSLLVLPSFAALAQVTVESPYIRATIPGTNVSSAYMEIVNHGDKTVTLIGASLAVSNKVEIHEHTMSNGMMKMQKREMLEIAANNKVVLQPSGYHLMIFNLEKGLKDGEEIVLTLHFKGHEDQKVVVPVQSIKRKKTAHHHH